MQFVYNSPINFNIPFQTFKSGSIYIPNAVPVKDGFNTNPLNAMFGTKAQIEAEARSNPRIKELLGRYNLPPKADTGILEGLKGGHLKNTRITAAKIYSALPQDLKNKINPQKLQEAAMLHDYGKVLIPGSILNKVGKLNDTEQKIIELHPELSYELLKDKGLSINTLNLIKNHHQNPYKTGYPAADESFEYGIEHQILSTADKYCALREKRSYKDEMTRKEALSIIKEDVNAEILSQEVYNALERAV